MGICPDNDNAQFYLNSTIYFVRRAMGHAGICPDGGLHFL